MATIATKSVTSIVSGDPSSLQIFWLANIFPGLTSSRTVIVNSAESTSQMVGSGPNVLIASLLNEVDCVRAVLKVRSWLVSPPIGIQFVLATSSVLYHW